MHQHFRSRNARDTFYGRQRQRVLFFAHTHEQRLRYGQSERQTNRESRAATRRRLRKQRATEFLDFRNHHVHAYAATGVLRNAAGGTKARLQNQLQRFFVGERTARFQQAALYRALAGGWPAQVPTREPIAAVQ